MTSTEPEPGPAPTVAGPSLPPGFRDYTPPPPPPPPPTPAPTQAGPVLPPGFREPSAHPPMTGTQGGAERSDADRSTHPADAAGNKLDVNPADLDAVAARYGELGTEMSTLPARGIEQINQVIATHGVMGYPVAVGMAAGMVKADEKLAAKIKDFVDHHQRTFIEHAATYRATDAGGASEIAGTVRF
ncbi:type VII secretion target [Mycobacteroides abscessus]|uniref:type VII secretion target n=1 Tax=Mycobacteroides abscessus TaxID=36809 RepID=UPI002102C8E8|nr:type VII secretion target [Mycobacteroides abscessus]